MRLRVEIADKQFEVRSKRTGNRVTAKVDDTIYELEISEPEPGFLLLKHDGRVYEVYAEPEAGPTGMRRFTINGQDVELRCIDPKRLRGSEGSKADMDGRAEIRTAMPGKVVKILAPEGSELKKGDGIVVVEAMKMQNELKSPRDGVVRSLTVTVGDAVASGQVIAVIE